MIFSVILNKSYIVYTTSAIKLLAHSTLKLTVVLNVVRIKGKWLKTFILLTIRISGTNKIKRLILSNNQELLS